MGLRWFEPTDALTSLSTACTDGQTHALSVVTACHASCTAACAGAWLLQWPPVGGVVLPGGFCAGCRLLCVKAEGTWVRCHSLTPPHDCSGDHWWQGHVCGQGLCTCGRWYSAHGGLRPCVVWVCRIGPGRVTPAAAAGPMVQGLGLKP